MKFISICSGIEAASVAFNTIGWEAVAFSEIEPFPSTLLAHHYPDIPNFGDMTKFKEWSEEVFTQADMIVGGPPCQSFSTAGKRQGLNDDRGNLTLIYTELIEHADNIRLKHGKPPVIIIYENVPGLLNDKTGAFGCFLGALAGEDCELQPAGKRWSNAGCVYGPERAIAWRILDAQYFGLAQRRKRVFVVASARDGFDPTKVLFEFDSVRRDIAPSREAREEAASEAGASFTSSSFGQYREGVGTLRAAGGDLGGGSETLALTQSGFRMVAFGEYADDDSASTMKARDYKDATDLVTYGMPGNWIGRKPENGGNSTQFMYEISPAQTATDKHGVIAFAQHSRDEVRCIGGGQIAGALAPSPGMKQTTYIAASGQESLTPWEQQGRRIQGVNGVSPTLLCNPAGGMKLEPILAFNSRQDPVSGALDTSSPQAQAIAIQGSMIGRKPENGPRGSGYDDTGVCFTQTAVDLHAVATTTAVRRLTPVECERLQGFPDGYTAIPWRGKPATECPDGHRYKALGNSMAVPVMRWIGERIDAHLGLTT